MNFWKYKKHKVEITNSQLSNMINTQVLKQLFASAVTLSYKFTPQELGYSTFSDDSGGYVYSDSILFADIYIKAKAVIDLVLRIYVSEDPSIHFIVKGQYSNDQYMWLKPNNTRARLVWQEGVWLLDGPWKKTIEDKIKYLQELVPRKNKEFEEIKKRIEKEDMEKFINNWSKE